MIASLQGPREMEAASIFISLGVNDEILYFPPFLNLLEPEIVKRSVRLSNLVASRIHG
jgi:hypothetical protein